MTINNPAILDTGDTDVSSSLMSSSSIQALLTSQGLPSTDITTILGVAAQHYVEQDIGDSGTLTENDVVLANGNGHSAGVLDIFQSAVNLDEYQGLHKVIVNQSQVTVDGSTDNHFFVAGGSSLDLTNTTGNERVTSDDGSFDAITAGAGKDTVDANGDGTTLTASVGALIAHLTGADTTFHDVHGAGGTENIFQTGGGASSFVGNSNGVETLHLANSQSNTIEIDPTNHSGTSGGGGSSGGGTGSGSTSGSGSGGTGSAPGGSTGIGTAGGGTGSVTIDGLNASDTVNVGQAQVAITNVSKTEATFTLASGEHVDLQAVNHAALVAIEANIHWNT
jgi:hypothetical protein